MTMAQDQFYRRIWALLLAGISVLMYIAALVVAIIWPGPAVITPAGFGLVFALGAYIISRKLKR